MITVENFRHPYLPPMPKSWDVPQQFSIPSFDSNKEKNNRLTAYEVVKNIRHNLRPLEDQIREHLYLNFLRERTLNLTALRAFPGYQYHIIHSDVRSIGMMIHRFSHPPIQSFFVQTFQGEVEGLTNLLKLAQRLGMSAEDLQHYPLTPGGFAYATYMGWLAMYGSAAEIVFGFLLNFPAWGNNCDQMSQSLQEQYGFSPEDTVFLDAFAKCPSFEEVALEIIQDGLDEGLEPSQLLRAGYLFQGYDLMFWDAMANIGMASKLE